MIFLRCIFFYKCESLLYNCFEEFQNSTGLVMLRISRLTYMIGHYCRPCFVATNLSAIANCCLAFEAEILRVTILLGNGPLLDQSGLDLGSPQSSGGLFSNGQAGDVNGWSPFQSEVRMLTINIIFFFFIWSTFPDLQNCSWRRSDVSCWCHFCLCDLALTQFLIMLTWGDNSFCSFFFF